MCDILADRIIIKGRPFGFHMLVDEKLYFGCGTFKNVFQQLTANPKVEVLAVNGGEFLRYDGTAKVVKDDALIAKVRGIMRRSWRSMIRMAGRWGCSVWKTDMPKSVP